MLTAPGRGGANTAEALQGGETRKSPNGGEALIETVAGVDGTFWWSYVPCSLRERASHFGAVSTPAATAQGRADARLVGPHSIGPPYGPPIKARKGVPEPPRGDAPSGASAQ